MRKVRMVGLGPALLVGCAGIAMAQNGGGIDYVELFQQLDANGDKIIDRGEVPESGRAAFDLLAKHADGNGDGRIDRDEYQQMLVSLREAFGAISERFDTIDKNGDGKITRAEFGGPPPIFARADTNRDGVITREEAGKFKPGAVAAASVGAGARLRGMDKNGDGKVSRDEFSGPPRVFDRMDANHDGFVTMQEAARMMRPGTGPAPEARFGPMTERIRAMDRNKDGKVSKDEFTGPGPVFDRLDRNSDGVISPDELPREREPPGAAKARGSLRRALVETGPGLESASLA